MAPWRSCSNLATSPTGCRATALQPKIDVRPLEANEWRLWRQMRMRALADSPDSFRPTLTEEQGHADSFWAEVVASTAAHPRGNLWLAWIQGVSLGMVFGRVDADFSTVELGSMWVDPDARNAGVGSALVSTVLSWGKELGVVSASLFCRQDDGVTAFYERHGFELTGETEPLRNGSAVTVGRVRARI